MTANASSAASSAPVTSARVPGRVRTRFAPSPTGFLHIGGVRTALYAWAFARHHGGDYVLRIEDTDVERSTPEAVAAILEGLDWLGLDADEGPFYQMQRMDRYRQLLDEMLADGRAYYCYATPEELEAMREAQRARGEKPRYDGRWRPENAAGKQPPADVKPVVRFRNPDDGVVVWDDMVKGRIAIGNAELDDLVIARSDGTPTYNFTTVVDDAMMGITHVIRGDDHLSNTPRQVIVYEAMGVPTPTFAHISMILGPDGKKLSKRHGATSVEEYRDRGYDADAFVNYLALLGWAPDGTTTIVSRDALAREFSLDRVSKNPATFDVKKLDWIQGQYLQAMSNEMFSKRVLIPELIRAGLEEGSVEEAYTRRPSWFGLLASLLRPRTTLAPEVIAKARFLYEGDNVTLDEKSVKKNLAKEGARASLEAAREALTSITTGAWTTAAIDVALEPLPERLDTSKRAFFGALRVAVCGNAVSPPLGESLELLGRDTTLARLARALPLAR